MDPLFSTSVFAHYLDSTNLRLEATEPELRALCREAAENGFCCVMVYPASVPLARSVLNGSPVRIGTVVGFPHGRSSTAAKEAEIVQAAAAGAAEVDIVMNYAALIAGESALAAAEIHQLVAASRRFGLLNKIILETCYLTEQQMLEALATCEEAEADFVKTSTGFGTAGAKIEQVRLLASRRRGPIKVKASGGIRTAADALAMIDAGAKRLGCSRAAAILHEFKEEYAQLSPERNHRWDSKS